MWHTSIMHHYFCKFVLFRSSHINALLFHFWSNGMNILYNICKLWIFNWVKLCWSKIWKHFSSNSSITCDQYARVQHNNVIVFWQISSQSLSNNLSDSSFAVVIWSDVFTFHNCVLLAWSKRSITTMDGSCFASFCIAGIVSNLTHHSWTMSEVYPSAFPILPPTVFPQFFSDVCTW